MLGGMKFQLEKRCLFRKREEGAWDDIYLKEILGEGIGKRERLS